jgi:DNA-binding SARP family transcriptional activator/Tfp pilus assembly protein PilF
MERRVLAVLLARVGAAVPVETLIDRVWDGDPPPSATDTLHSYISRIRSRLRAAAGDRASLDYLSRTYSLRTDPATVDLRRYQRLQHQGRKTAEAGDAEGAVELLREAESLWRGDEPLAGLSGEWAANFREQINEEHRSGREIRIRLELDLGRHSDLIGELRELAARSPVVEPVIADLMTALYRCGRSSEALTAYRRARRRLRDELGLDPSPGLDDLHQRILRRDPGLLLSETVRHRKPVPPESAPPPDNLLRDIPDFTGREDELRSLISESVSGTGTALPLSVVHGMPGVGKTTLVVHAAHLLREQYPAGGLYLNLQAHSQQRPLEPGQALAQLLLAIGVGVEQLPPECEERAALWRERMARRKALLILDDARDAAQVRPLLPGAATCRVLVTSRHHLHDLEGARSLSLDVPTATEAAALFSRVAGAGRISDSEALRQVVELCGCHPLALQLAASRFRHRDGWDIRDLADRLAQAPATPGEINLPEGVFTAFSLSYTELPPSQRHLLRCLALHPGPDLTLGVACALTGSSPADVRRGMDELTDSHLIEEVAKDRYRLHDLLRGFGRRAGLHEDSDAARSDALSRLLDLHITVADHADRLAHPHRRRLDVTPAHQPAYGPVLLDAGDGQAWLDVERSNLLATARTAAAVPTSHAALFPHVLAHAFHTWGSWEAAAELYLAALSLSGSDPSLTAQLRVEYAAVLWSQGCHEAALHQATEALALGVGHEDLWAQAQAHVQIGRAHLVCGRRGEASAHLEQALALHEAVGSRSGMADTLNLRAIALSYAGRNDEALACFRAIRRIREEIGDPQGELRALNNIGEIHALTGDHDKARAYYESSLALARRFGGRQELAILFGNLGNVCLAGGAVEKALDYYHRSLESYRATGDPRCEADALINIGAAHRALGRHHEAVIHFTMADRIATRIGDHYGRLRSLTEGAAAELAAERHSAALATYREALRVARELDIPLAIATALDGIAQTLTATQGAAAGEYAEQALALYDRLGITEEASALRRRLAAPGAT